LSGYRRHRHIREIGADAPSVLVSAKLVTPLPGVVSAGMPLVPGAVMQPVAGMRNRQWSRRWRWLVRR
jgi:hypothetical protein